MYQYHKRHSKNFEFEKCRKLLIARKCQKESYICIEKCFSINKCIFKQFVNLHCQLLMRKIVLLIRMEVHPGMHITFFIHTSRDFQRSFILFKNRKQKTSHQCTTLVYIPNNIRTTCRKINFFKNLFQSFYFS